jgi:hypothetical protein
MYEIFKTKKESEIKRGINREGKGNQRTRKDVRKGGSEQSTVYVCMERTQRNPLFCTTTVCQQRNQC